MPVNAGDLDKWLILQRPRDDSDPRDALGQPADDWPAIAGLWAKVEPLGSAETFSANQTRGSLTHRVTIRWRAGVESNMRFFWDDRRSRRKRILQIDGLGVDPDERGELLQFVCQEIEVENEAANA